MRHILVLALALCVFANPLDAEGKVVLPDGKTIPVPAVSCGDGKTAGLAAIFACACLDGGACNIGKACPGDWTGPCDEGKNSTCESRIWHDYNTDPCIPEHLEGLDPVEDAATKPETFKPVCGHTFTLLTRGTAVFKNAFGWYNAVAGKKPAAAEMFVMIGCDMTAGKRATLDLTSDPRYAGGEIGFFLVTPESHTESGRCHGGDCCATIDRAVKGEGRIYYSEPAHNPDTGWIHLLSYNSKLDPHKFFFAWEDTFKGHTTDYSDFVTSVTGISCAGAGVRCDTGQPGVCAEGVSTCDVNGKLICEASVKPSAERCDALDNDCDGTVDNAATCDGDMKCFNGTCVGKCTSSLEFPCRAGYDCDRESGLCVDGLCKGVTCKEGEICRGGQCANGCDGVVCPHRQICAAGICVDMCKGSDCAPGEVCRFGVCVANCSQCGGLTCLQGERCDPVGGDCYSATCSAPCAAGTFCKEGKCLDLCDGVICPGATDCRDGQCAPPGIGIPVDARDSGPLGDTWVSAVKDGGGSTGQLGLNDSRPFNVKPGCCSMSATPAEEVERGWPLALLFALGLVARRRRRR